MKILHCYARVQGLRAHYLDAGAGPPLLLVASQVVLARSYRSVIPRLAQHFRVITVDLPGCGHSERTGRYWGPDRYADWLAAFIEALRLGPVTVAGHSNSGPVALTLAARHPRQVDRLMLLDSIGARDTRSLAALLVARAVDAALEPALTLQAWPHPLYNLLVHPRNFLGQVRAAAALDVLDVAARVRVPTLIGWGRIDHTMPPSCSGRLRSSILDSRLYLSAGSHDWCITRGEEFAAVAAAFAQGQPQSNTAPAL